MADDSWGFFDRNLNDSANQRRIFGNQSSRFWMGASQDARAVLGRNRNGEDVPWLSRLMAGAALVEKVAPALPNVLGNASSGVRNIPGAISGEDDIPQLPPRYGYGTPPFFPPQQRGGRYDPRPLFPQQAYPPVGGDPLYIPQSFDPAAEADVRATDALYTSPRHGAPSIPRYPQEYNSASIVEHQFAAALSTDSTLFGLGDDKFTGRYKDANLPISAETVAQLRDNVEDLDQGQRAQLARSLNNVFAQSGLRVQITSTSEDQLAAGLAAFAASNDNPAIQRAINEGMKQTTLSGGEQRPMFKALVEGVFETEGLVHSISQMQAQQTAVRRNGAPTQLIPDQPAAGRGSDGFLARGDLSRTGEKVGGMDVDDLQAKLAEAGLGDMLGSTGVDGNYGSRTEATVKYAAALLEEAGVGYIGNVDATGKADADFIKALNENLPKVKQQADRDRA